MLLSSLNTSIFELLVEVDELVGTLLSQYGIIHVSIVIVYVGFTLLLGYVFFKHLFDCRGTLCLKETKLALAFDLKLNKMRKDGRL